MRIFYHLTKWTLPGFLLLPASCNQKYKEDIFPLKPNIILIIADDMNWNDCGAYGHPYIRTPNIDRLSSDGMKFTNAFLTTSSCSPTRASLITGSFPHQTNAQQLHWPIPADKITFVEKLKEAGYWTAQAGKWHMGNAVMNRFDFLATEKAFKDLTKEGQTNTLPPSDGSNCQLWIPTLNHRPDDKPFFLWLASNDPHRPYRENTIPVPHQPSDVILPPYLPDEIEVRKDFALYYDEISRMDAYIGELIAELDKQNLSENTLILFISDNGRPFPRDKTTLYDGGIKMPFIIKWPLVIKPGSVSNSLVSIVDVAPTLLKLAGIKPVDTFSGKDFSPVLNYPDKQTREYIFAQAHWHDVDRMYRAVRDTKFKYIRNFYPDLANTPPADALKSRTYAKMLELKEKELLNEAEMNIFISPTPVEELYDTENDPFELTNLASNPAYADKLNKMQKLLQEIMEETNDKIPETRTPDEYDRRTGDPLPNRKMSRKN